MVRTIILIMCLVFVSFVSAEEPQQIVALEFTGTLPDDYEPPIDTNAQYRVEITFTFNDIDGNLALWLSQEMKKYQIVDETCSYEFKETRVSEKDVAVEELGDLQREVEIERKRVLLENELAELKKEREKIANGETVRRERIASRSNPAYEYCMANAGTAREEMYCEQLR